VSAAASSADRCDLPLRAHGDDIADEGDAAPDARLADLAAFRADLIAVAGRSTPSPRWPEVFGPLAVELARHRLPVTLLADLLDAFAQDAGQTRYADRAELLDYCRRSANPIGRCCCTSTASTTPARSRAPTPSAARCSSPTSGRTSASMPRADVSTCRRRCVTARRRNRRVARAARQRSRPHPRRRPRRLGARADALGRAARRRDRRRAGWELRFVVQGGLRVLEKIDRLGGATLIARPTIGAADAPLLAWRALTMRRGSRRAANARRRRHTPTVRERSAVTTPEQYVQQKAAASGSSFYYAFLFLTPPRRAAITAFYAFCRKSTTSPTRSRTPASPRPSWPGGAAKSAPRSPATRATRRCAR
jgi:hypothetical protein